LSQIKRSEKQQQKQVLKQLSNQVGQLKIKIQ